jgi:heme/copper-type cytochrome/quinol oxidase subunit 2
MSLRLHIILVIIIIIIIIIRRRRRRRRSRTKLLSYQTTLHVAETANPEQLQHCIP